MLAVLLHTPVPPDAPPLPSWWDKPLHAILYGGLTWLAGWHNNARGATTTRRTHLTWLVVFAVYAAVDELTQPLSSRTASLGDWAADAVGIGAVTIWLNLSRRTKRLSATYQT